MKNSFKAAIFALALTVSVGASAQGYMFNNNLKMGARGADVSALQAVLVSEGHLAVSPTGYFGSLTLKAVKAYQLAKGITPVSGFVGPITRAALNAASPVVTNPTTPTTPVLSGTEGFAEYRQGVQPVDNTNITTNTNVDVYGIELKAKNSDISFERLTLDVAVVNANTSSTENPGTFINKITVKDGSTVIASVPVNTSSFSKYSGTNNYYIQLTGLSSKVMKESTKNFVVAFDTNYIDSNRNVTVNVAANGARVVDGRGISTYNAAAVGARNHVFKKPGSSTATLQADATTVYSQNYQIDRDNGAREAFTSTFAVKSTTGTSKITGVTVSVATTSGNVSSVYLYRGSTLLASRSLSGTSVTFDIESSNIVVAKDATETFSIKVDVPSTYSSTTAQTSVTSVTYEKADGSSATASATVAGPYHYFAKIVPMFSKVSSTAEVIKNGPNSAPSSISAKFVLNIQPKGGNLSTTTVAIIDLINTATGAVTASSTVTGSLTETSVTSITENATKEVTYSATFASSTANGTYRAVMRSLTWTSTGVDGATATSTGLDALNTSTFTY